MKPELVIMGAGMAGLLAANMLRHMKPRIIEIKGELPDNHGALLRFKTNSVSSATGIPFKEVNVSKGIYNEGNVLSESNIMLNNKYSARVSGRYTGRSITNLADEPRFIAPHNFIQSASHGVDIRYGTRLSQDDLTDIALSSGIPVISTIPMPALMDLLEYKDKRDCKFEYSSITAYQLTMSDVDLYQTIYVPDESDSDFYRVSITGNTAIFETTRTDLDMPRVMDGMQDILFRAFGIYGVITAPELIAMKHQKFGKLISRDRAYCRRFISWATKERNIYSLGRFSTWRQVLLDDCIGDINAISNLINSENYRR